MGRRILIIEDEPDFAEILSVRFGELGYESRLAGAAGEALEAIRAFEPDVVLCDVHLPGESGVSVLDAIRRGDGPNPAFIFLTALPDARTLLHSALLKADGVYRKTATLDQIVQAVEGVAARREAAAPPGI